MNAGADGYSFDKATGEHVLRFRERVPRLWAIYPKTPMTRTVATGLCAALGFLIGSTMSGGAVFALTIAGGLTGYFQWSKWIGRITPHTFTGKREQRNGGRIADFLVEWRGENTGTIARFREFEKAKAKDGYDGVQRFHPDEIASIERRTFDQEYPDAPRNPTSIPGRRQRADVANLHMLTIVFRDGQEIHGGWIEGGNAAAVTQSDLIKFLDAYGALIRSQQAESMRRQGMDPDDTPL